MAILVTIWLTCLGLIIIGAAVDAWFNASQQSNFSEAIAFFATVTVVVLFIAILTIGFYTGDIKNWVSP